MVLLLLLLLLGTAAELLFELPALIAAAAKLLRYAPSCVYFGKDSVEMFVL